MSKIKPLNLSILQNKKSTIISTQESLEDVIPMNWSEEVLLEKKKVLIDKNIKVSKAIKKCSKKYKKALNNLGQ